MYATENLILTSPLLWILFLVTAVLCFLEYWFSKKWIFVVAFALWDVAAIVLLLVANAALSELLLYILGVLFIRLCFVMLERRKNG